MEDEEIIDAIKKFSKYSSFQVKNFPKSINQKILNVYMKNLRLARGTFHMEMLIAALNYNSDNPNDTLFIVPPIFEFFRDIFSEPLKIMQCYPAMFNQKIGNLIALIYNKPSEFAKIVFNFFKNDASHLLLFAFTTFPSIFVMFMGEEFCQCALEFLLTILDLAKNMETEIIENLKKQKSGKIEKVNWNQIVLTFFPTKICDAFISSFFCGAPGFYETLWVNLSQRLFKYVKKPPFNVLFDCTLKSLKEALPYLTKYHIAAITKYSSALPQRCNKFFIEKLILQPFLRETTSSTLFSSPNMNNAYAEFLRELLSPIRLVYSDQLLNAVIINKKFLSITPHMEPSNAWSHGLPLILNDNDIFTLYKMMQYSKTFSFSHTTNDIVFSESYRPVIIDVYPTFLKQRKISMGIMEGLFGRAPPSFTFVNNKNDKTKIEDSVQSNEDKNLKQTDRQKPTQPNNQKQNNNQTQNSNIQSNKVQNNSQTDSHLNNNQNSNQTNHHSNNNIQNSNQNNNNNQNSNIQSNKTQNNSQTDSHLNDNNQNSIQNNSNTQNSNQTNAHLNNNNQNSNQNNNNRQNSNQNNTRQNINQNPTQTNSHLNNNNQNKTQNSTQNNIITQNKTQNSKQKNINNNQKITQNEQFNIKLQYDTYNEIDNTIQVTETFPDNYTGLWGNFKSLSQDRSGIDTASFFFSPLSADFFKDTKFRRFAGYQILNEFSNNFNSVEQTILLYEHHSALKEIGELTSQHNITLYHHLTVDIFKKKIMKPNDLFPTLKDFFLSDPKSKSKRLILAQSPSSSSSNLIVESLTNSPVSSIYHRNSATAKSKRITFPGSVCFEISCIALDCTHFKASQKMIEAQKMFMGMLNSWMEKEWPEQSRVCHFNNKIKYVLDATTLLGQLQFVGLGKKLKIILAFQKRLQVILGHYWDKDWSIIFNYAIFAANAPIIFRVFLTLHHFIFVDNEVVAGWGKNVHNTWGLFSAGMWYVMKRNPAFCSFCSNIEECKQLFIIE